MSQFVDGNGLAWSCEVNYGTVRDIKNSVGVDILNAPDQAIETLGKDLHLAVDALFIICRKQCQERHLSDRDFGEVFRGDSLSPALDALLEAITDFFPSPRREMYRLIAKKAGAARATMMSKMEPMMSLLDKELDQMFAWNDSSGNAPESLVSIPTVGPSAI